MAGHAVADRYELAPPEWVKQEWDPHKRNVYDWIKDVLASIEIELTIMQPELVVNRELLAPRPGSDQAWFRNTVGTSSVKCEIWHNRTHYSIFRIAFPPLRAIVKSIALTPIEKQAAFNTANYMRAAAVKPQYFHPCDWEEAKRRWKAFSIEQREAMGLYGGFSD